MKEVNSSNNLSYTPQSYTVQDFPLSRPNWVPYSLTRKRVLLLPPLSPRGESHYTVL
jgi:hypothetical protein